MRCSVTIYFAIEKSEQSLITPAKRADKVNQTALGENGFIELAVKWLCFTFYPQVDKPPKKKKKRRKKPKKSKTKKNSSNQSIPSSEVSETTVSETEKADDTPKTEEKPKEESAENTAQTPPDGHKVGKKKPKKEKKSKKSDEEKVPLKEKLADLKQKWLMIKPYLPLAKKSFLRLLKLIRFYDFELYLNVADKDSCEAALKFGKMNGIVYNALAAFMQVFTVKIKHTNIGCKFNNDKMDFGAKFYVKVRPSTLLRIVFSAAFSALFIFLRERRKAKKAKKLAQKQNAKDSSEENAFENNDNNENIQNNEMEM